MIYASVIFNNKVTPSMLFRNKPPNQNFLPLPELHISLINLNILEDCSNKFTRCPMTQSPTKCTQTQRNQQHVPKVKRRLDQAIHACFECEVVNGIKEDVESC